MTFLNSNYRDVTKNYSGCHPYPSSYELDGPYFEYSCQFIGFLILKCCTFQPFFMISLHCTKSKFKSIENCYLYCYFYFALLMKNSKVRILVRYPVFLSEKKWKMTVVFLCSNILFWRADLLFKLYPFFV